MISVVAFEAGHVRNGAEVLELVGVDDATYRLDYAVQDFEGKNADVVLAPQARISASLAEDRVVATTS
ncbi:MAG TPA: hypothetical protein VNZ26_05480 [Vicinamibacterales bacterium]|nr:hypothetical protein [Vicinamibacterales bacterium]